MADQPILFDDFVEGADIGSESFTIDEAALERWTALFPADAKCRPYMPPGMVAMIVMRAYMHVITPRPPGNIHAEQQYDIRQLPKIGDTVTTSFKCGRKQERVGRKWVYLETVTKDVRDVPLFVGYSTTIWSR